MASWTKGQLWLLYAGVVFALLFVATASEAMQWLPSPRPWLNPWTEAAAQWTAKVIFQQGADFYSPISSDALGLVFHLFNGGVVAALGAILLVASPARHWNADKVYYGLRTFLSYYVALQLLLYGFNKVFKYQFYLPEPNTLYTTVGETPRDLLFWSVMGSAYGYTVFAGLLEVIAGSLLLFRKTRLLGGLLAIVLFTHIIAVNFGFNISVKIYSCCYGVFTIIALLPHWRRLFAFLLHDQWIAPTHWQPRFTQVSTRLAYASIKTLVVGLLLLESCYPYFKNNNFNDDSQPRPAFHGAYLVESFIKDGISYPDRAIYTQRWQRAFVHRRGYFIVQYAQGNTQDYQFAYDDEQGLFELVHPQTQARSILRYVLLPDGNLRLEGNFEGARIEVFLKQLAWRSLPLLQYEFNWTIDPEKGE